MDLNITTPAAPDFVNKGLDQGHHFRQYLELGKSEHHVSLSTCAVVAILMNPGTVLVMEAATAKDPGICLQASWALNGARSRYRGGKANIKPGSCHFEESVIDGVQAH